MHNRCLEQKITDYSNFKIKHGSQLWPGSKQKCESPAAMLLKGRSDEPGHTGSRLATHFSDFSDAHKLRRMSINCSLCLSSAGDNGVSHIAQPDQHHHTPPARIRDEKGKGPDVHCLGSHCDGQTGSLVHS